MGSLTDRQLAQGRWISEATDAQVKAVMRAKAGDRCEVIEWEPLGQTFILHYDSLVMVRCSLLGGDTVTVHGGWKYHNELAMHLDAAEIYYVKTTVHR